MKIGHLMNPFLPVTHNWIYHQLVFNTKCSHFILCQTRLNEGIFPFANVYCVRKSGPAASVASIVNRIRARYPQGPYLKAIRAEKPDVLHGHFAWESWRNIGLVRATRLPLVTTFYGLDVNKLPRRAVWRKRYRELFRIGGAFVTEGEHMAACLQRIGCPAAKIRVVRIGVDTERIKPVDKPGGRSVRLLFVGLSREKKGAEYAAAAFVRAARQCPDIELHLVGDGPYRERVAGTIAGAGLADCCRFHGRLDVEGYRALLETIDICLAPSVTASDGDTEGGAPVTVIEAQAAGIPVVATNHCDIPNVVTHGETGLLCQERDAEGLAGAIVRLASDGALRTRMGQAARSRACARHDIRTQVIELTRVYESVLAH